MSMTKPPPEGDGFSLVLPGSNTVTVGADGAYASVGRSLPQ